MHVFCFLNLYNLFFWSKIIQLGFLAQNWAHRNSNHIYTNEMKLKRVWKWLKYKVQNDLWKENRLKFNGQSNGFFPFYNILHGCLTYGRCLFNCELCNWNQNQLKLWWQKYYTINIYINKLKISANDKQKTCCLQYRARHSYNNWFPSYHY